MSSARRHPITKIIARLTGLKDEEVAAALLSAGCFLLILCCWYILRPMRDEVGAHLGREVTGDLWYWVFYVMLVVTPVYMWVAGRCTRNNVLPIVYRFFAVTLVAFVVLLNIDEKSEIGGYIGRAFYVWCGVFNLFIVSMFWAFMADSCHHRASKRMFGVIAVGGTVGAIAGSGIVALLSKPIPFLPSVDGTDSAFQLPAWSLLLISAVLLEACCQMLRLVRRQITSVPGNDHEPQNEHASQQLKSNYLEGLLVIVRSPYLLLICLFIGCYCITSSFLYFMQIEIAGSAFEERAARREFFASVDLYVNITTLVLQCFLTGRLMSRVGVGLTLLALPVLATVGFAALAANPTLGFLVMAIVIRRAGNFAFAKPAREVLFTLVPTWQKYKSKVFIDTVVYRGADAGGSSLYNALNNALSDNADATAGEAVADETAGSAIATMALVAIPITTAWAVIAGGLGVMQKRRTERDIAEE